MKSDSGNNLKLAHACQSSTLIIHTYSTQTTTANDLPLNNSTGRLLFDGGFYLGNYDRGCFFETIFSKHFPNDIESNSCRNSPNLSVVSCIAKCIVEIPAELVALVYYFGTVDMHQHYMHLQIFWK